MLFSGVFMIAGFKLADRTHDRDLWPPVQSQLGATLSDYWLAIQLSLANLMPGNLRGNELGFSLPSQATKAWAIAQVIVTYILLTLLLLAIRRRFRR